MTRAGDSGIDFEVVIVGSGFSGIGTAIELKRQGIDDFVILERADDLGGTWRDNTSPGLTVDVASTSYSYGLEPNPEWSRLYAPGAEVKRDADHCAQSRTYYFDKNGDAPLVRPATQLGSWLRSHFVPMDDYTFASSKPGASSASSGVQR